MTGELAQIHAPTPGELYSSVSGSAITTIIDALATANARTGRATGVLVREGLAHEARRAHLLPAHLPDKVWLTRSEKVRDAAAVAIGRLSPGYARFASPLYDAVPVDYEGPVVLHNAPAGVQVLRRQRPRAKPVLYLHNQVLRAVAPWRRAALAASCHTVVCVSEFIARASFGDRLPTNVRVLVNGTEPLDGASDEPENDPVVVLFVGKMQPHKGAHLLLEAAKLLAQDEVRFTLRFVGGAVLSASSELTGYEKDLRRAAVALGQQVEFVPFVDRNAIADVYASADVFCLPSDWDEPCALALPEAMRAGLACVSSPRGGLTELGGGAPVYVDPRDTRELARQIGRLVVDSGARTYRRGLARQRASEISWERQAARLADWLAEPR